MLRKTVGSMQRKNVPLLKLYIYERTTGTTTTAATAAAATAATSGMSALSVVVLRLL